MSNVTHDIVAKLWVVALEERGSPGEFWFLTAFPAQRYVEKIRRESTFLESKEPQS